MNRIETENPRHLPGVFMRCEWFSRPVHLGGLEPSTSYLSGQDNFDKPHNYIDGKPDNAIATSSSE